MIRYFFAFVLVVGLVGCSQQAAAPSPSSAVYALKNTYEAALIVAVNYNELPRCGRTTSPVCSDQAAVEAIRKANVAARTTLDAAEKTVRDTGAGADVKTAVVEAANNAVVALQAILTLYAKKG